jgi:5,10-methylenetetrahydromethanopterin reductase
MSKISIAFQTNKSINAYGELATKAEAYGFDGVSLYNDMLFQPAWLPLLEMARVTKRVSIGVAAVNPFTCHPINIAGNIALLNEMATGRAYLGMARGAWLDFVGIDPLKPITALREAFASVRHLLQQNKSPLAGEFFPLAGGDSLRWDIPHPDVPFMLGTWGEKTIQACADWVQELKLGGTANPGAVTWLGGLLAKPLDIAVGAVTVVAMDGAEARAIARREVALYLPVVASLDKSLQIEPDRIAGIQQAANQFDYEKAATYISDELLQKFAFAGTPHDIIKQTEALFQAGASRVEFGTPHGISTADGMRLLGKHVLPHFK